MPVMENGPVNLWLDVLALEASTNLKACHVNIDIEVPDVPTMLFFIVFMCSSRKMLRLLVVVTKMSTTPTTLSNAATWKPSMQTRSAQSG